MNRSLRQLFDFFLTFILQKKTRYLSDHLFSCKLCHRCDAEKVKEDNQKNKLQNKTRAAQNFWVHIQADFR